MLRVMAKLWHILLVVSAGCVASAKEPGEAAVLKAGGKGARVLVEKAHGILEKAEVFASGAVGFAGARTSNCWALTVVVRYDPQGEAFLEKLYATARHPEAKAYAVAGLITLDPKAKKRFALSKLPDELKDTHIESITGCELSHESFGTAVSVLLEFGAGQYLYDKLPPLDSTSGMSRMLKD